MKFKEMFIVFKKEESSILVYPFKETSWQMDKFLLGHKLAKKFPTHAQTIKVLSLMNFPFFYDFTEDKIKVLKEPEDDFEKITAIWQKYYSSPEKKIDEVFDFNFVNRYKEDSEMLLPFVKKEEVKS